GAAVGEPEQEKFVPGVEPPIAPPPVAVVSMSIAAAVQEASATLCAVWRWNQRFPISTEKATAPSRTRLIANTTNTMAWPASSDLRLRLLRRGVVILCSSRPWSKNDPPLGCRTYIHRGPSQTKNWLVGIADSYLNQAGGFVAFSTVIPIGVCQSHVGVVIHRHRHLGGVMKRGMGIRLNHPSRASNRRTRGGPAPQGVRGAMDDRISHTFFGGIREHVVGVHHQDDLNEAQD